jgi:hypothetical protein
VKKLRVIIWCAVAFIFAVSCVGPSDSAIQGEFVSKHPGVKIIGKELIFEQGNHVVYLVKYKQHPDGDVLTEDFAMKRENGTWAWCDDQTERKCGPIGE